MTRRGRPARPLAPMPVSAMILVIWWLVAHNSGSGWVQAIGDVAFGTLTIGVVGPSVVLFRAKVRIVSAPNDATVGLPMEVLVDASTRLRVRADPPFDGEGLVGPGGRRRTADARITLVPQRRGVHDTLTLDIATAAPFALQWWSRRIVLPLPSALHVAPRRGRPHVLPVQPHEDAHVSVARAARDTGEPRGARPYRPGDNRQQVHWRATAHTGEMMVRELERPSAGPVTLTVTLPRDPEEAERVAERALATIVLLLDKGTSVLLATREASGQVLAPVSDRRGGGRRLARAVAGTGSSDQFGQIAVSP